MATSRLTMACLRSQYPGPHGHGDREHGRHGHGDGRHRQDEGELQGLQHGITPEQGHRQDKEHQGQSEDDQVVADLQDGTLEVAHRVCRRYQTRRLAEVGILARAVDQSVDLALFDDRTGVDGIARRVGYGE